MAITLKDKLVHCLSAINQEQPDSRLGRTLFFLKKPSTQIPVNDEANVLLFLSILSEEIPEIKKNPLLKGFCLPLTETLSLREKSVINTSSRHK